MSYDIDTQDNRPRRAAEQSVELDHITVENDGEADECAMFPREATEQELMTNWITAHDDSFVALESMR